MTRHMPRIAVIGGGLSGLAAAHRLQELAADAPVEIVLLEAGNRLGGVAGTAVEDGFIMETGPDSFITEKPAAFNLSKRLGLEPEIIRTASTGRRSFVVHAGALTPVPAGFQMIAPSAVGPFLRSSIVGVPGRLRALWDLVLPRRTLSGDESVASFVRRRFGQQVLDRLAAPMVGGVYGADPERLSARATIARFVQLEQTGGSVIRALRAAQDKQQSGPASGPRYGLFASYRRGMQTLADALTARLAPGVAHLGVAVESIARTAGGWALALNRPLTAGATLGVDGVILALPAHRAATILASEAPSLSGELAGIPYSASITVSLGYERAAVTRLIDGFGFVVPSIEGFTIVAASISSSKYPGRAPEGKVLLRAFLRQDAAGLGDGAVTDLAHNELARLLGISAGPVLSLVSRHDKAMPQYEVGHLERVARIAALTAELPGLALAGNGYSGVGVPDCVASGERAAETVLTAVRQDNAALLQSS